MGVDFNLGGKTVLVIGGSSGIGRELALGFKQAGALVLVAGRDQSKLDKVGEELGGANGQPHTHVADVRSHAALKGLASRIMQTHGRIDILVNCQGTTVIKPALEVTEDEYDTVLDTNLKSVFFACTVFGAHMAGQGGGAIINIASLAAHNGWAQAAPYSMSKWGVLACTKSLAAEWGDQNVRVNAVAPGFFMTDLNRERMTDERKNRARERTAMHRMGELHELVGAAIFLASPASGFVTGTILNVDGGYLASGI